MLMFRLQFLPRIVPMSLVLRSLDFLYLLLIAASHLCALQSVWLSAAILWSLYLQV